MIYTKEKLEELNRITRLKIINSVTGIKPANLIGTMIVICRVEYHYSLLIILLSELSQHPIKDKPVKRQY